MKLSDKEQRNVRAALRFLRFRAGSWASVAEALDRSQVTVTLVAGGTRPANAELAFGVARAIGASIDDLLAGELRICPHCGRPPDDFGDEHTVIEDEARSSPPKAK